MKQYYGEYNATHYSIVDAETGEEVYTAGNSRWDSQGYLSADSSDAVSLETMKRHCETTLNEHCEEEGAKVLGVQLAEEDEVAW